MNTKKAHQYISLNLSSINFAISQIQTAELIKKSNFFAEESGLYHCLVAQKILMYLCSDYYIKYNSCLSLDYMNESNNNTFNKELYNIIAENDVNVAELELLINDLLHS